MIFLDIYTNLKMTKLKIYILVNNNFNKICNFHKIEIYHFFALIPNLGTDLQICTLSIPRTAATAETPPTAPVAIMNVCSDLE